MKKSYTKKQITEAIAYWEKQLKKMNESSDGKEYFTAHVTNIDWQPVDDEDEDDTFESVDIEIEKDELGKIEEVIHDYLNDHCQSSGVEGYDYEIVIKSYGH